VDLIKFNKAKCKVLHTDQDNPQYQYTVEDEGIENSPEEKDLGILVDEKTGHEPVICTCSPESKYKVVLKTKKNPNQPTKQTKNTKTTHD